MKLLVKLPTRGRPIELEQRLKEYHSKSHVKSTYVVVVCDNDDTTCNNPMFKTWVEAYPNTKLYFGDSKTKIEAHNAHVEDEDWDILIAASDDMIPEEGYDETIINEMFNHFPDTDGALWFNTAENDMTCTLTIIGRKLYDTFGYVYNPSYKSFYCDDEFSRVAAAMGKLKRINKTVIKHKTYQDNHPPDATFLKSMVKSIHDMTLYKTRRGSNFGIPNSGAIDKDYPEAFLKKRDNGNNWMIPMPKLEDRIDPLEIYILEQGWREVTQMEPKEFASFAKAFFRNMRMTTPRIIHQIWMGETIPKAIGDMMDTFKHAYKNKYPGWKHILWTDKKLLELPMINKDLFINEQRMDCKSDIARLEILRQFGGWYVDADCVWLGNKSLEDIGQNQYGFNIAYEKEGSIIGKGYLDGSTTRVANTIIGSTIENPLMAYLTGKLVKSYAENRKHGVVASTGPDFIQSTLDALKENGLNIPISPSDKFYPIWWCNDPKKNPMHKEYLEGIKMSGDEMARKYPNAICFHRGYTAATEGVAP